MNLFSLAKAFPTEEHALAYWIKARWPDGVRCLGCDCAKCWLIETKGKTGKVVRLFECSDCGLHFSATTGTLFHDSHLPLQKWFAAIAIMVESKKGISAAQMKRHLGVTYKTAWFLCHRIRQAMQEAPSFTVGGPETTVEIDEMFVGGRNRLQGHKNTAANKTVVLGLAERDGQIHMQTIAGAKTEPIRQVIDAKLDPKTPTVVTDEKNSYRKVIPPKKHIHSKHKARTGEAELHIHLYGRERILPVQAGYRWQLSQAERRTS